jgi:hypothetical protein
MNKVVRTSKPYQPVQKTKGYMCNTLAQLRQLRGEAEGAASSSGQPAAVSRLNFRKAAPLTAQQKREARVERQKNKSKRQGKRERDNREALDDGLAQVGSLDVDLLATVCVEVRMPAPMKPKKKKAAPRKGPKTNAPSKRARR